MRYIFPDVHKRHHEAPISVYFNSAGHEVVPFPCPDVDAFLCANYLCTWDVSFVGNPPHYINPTGQWIIQDTTFSIDAGVNLSWLPKPPEQEWHSASFYSNPASVGVHGHQSPGS
jgi:hypothetical protein